MTKSVTTPPSEGLEVYAITYDEEGNEVRLLPAEATGADVDRSRDLGIDRGRWKIGRIKHGPLIAAESQLRQVNVGSLGRAIAGNTYGTLLVIDRTPPPMDNDVYEIDGRYEVDLADDVVVAVVTQRYPSEPTETAADIAARLARIASAYGCRIADVSFALPGGGSPDDMLAQWPEGEKWAEQIRAETLATLADMAHDVKVSLAADDYLTMAALMDGAAALAEYLSATQTGPLDGAGVLNLLRGGHFKLLIGQKESDYLEVKTAMHPIWVAGTPGEKAKIELAQDVARFANSDGDAVLVIGYRESSGGDHEIGALTPVADQYLNPAQIGEVLDARIVPPLDGLLVETFQVAPKESVLAVYVPKQPREMQPYLVHGAIAAGKVEGAFFSIVRRRGEASITTSAQDIHAYIVAGKRYLRGED